MYYWAVANPLYLLIFPVKCIRHTPAYFAERLHKAMQVCRLFYYLFILIIANLVHWSWMWVRGWKRWFHTEVKHCYVSTGSGDQGHNPDPHHGVPLWGWYVGHQAGLCADLWEITVHPHLSKSRSPGYYYDPCRLSSDSKSGILMQGPGWISPCTYIRICVLCLPYFF